MSDLQQYVGSCHAVQPLIKLMADWRYYSMPLSKMSQGQWNRHMQPMHRLLRRI